MTMDCSLDVRDPEFQRVFRAYFQEFGITLKENTDVFDEIRKSQDEEGMQAILLWEGNRIIGFLLYQIEGFESQSGFFTEKMGFLRELWVDPDNRKQNWGTRLLEAVYEKLCAGGVCKILLTYDEDAIGFYEKLGYQYDDSYSAKNQMRCMVKCLGETKL